MTLFKKQFNIQLASVNRNIRDFGKEQVKLLRELIDTVKTLKFKFLPTGDLEAYAQGGVLTNNQSKARSVKFVPKGPDTVPMILPVGSGVIPKESVKANTSIKRLGTVVGESARSQKSFVDIVPAGHIGVMVSPGELIISPKKVNANKKLVEKLILDGRKLQRGRSFDDINKEPRYLAIGKFIKDLDIKVAKGTQKVLGPVDKYIDSKLHKASLYDMIGPPRNEQIKDSLLTKIKPDVLKQSIIDLFHNTSFAKDMVKKQVNSPITEMLSVVSEGMPLMGLVVRLIKDLSKAHEQPGKTIDNFKSNLTTLAKFEYGGMASTVPFGKHIGQSIYHVGNKAGYWREGGIPGGLSNNSYADVLPIITRAINESNLGKAVDPKNENSNFAQTKKALDASQMGLQAKDEMYRSTHERLAELRNRQLTPAVETGTNNNIPTPAELSPIVRPQKSWLAKVIDGVIQAGLIGAVLIPILAPFLKELFKAVLGSETIASIKSYIPDFVLDFVKDKGPMQVLFDTLKIGLAALFTTKVILPIFKKLTGVSLGQAIWDKLGKPILTSVVEGLAWPFKFAGKNIGKLLGWTGSKISAFIVPKLFQLSSFIGNTVIGHIFSSIGGIFSGAGGILKSIAGRLFTGTGGILSKVIGIGFPKLIGGLFGFLFDGILGGIKGFKEGGVMGMITGFFKGALTSSSITGNALKYAMAGLMFGPPGFVIGGLIGGAVQWIVDNWGYITNADGKGGLMKDIKDSISKAFTVIIDTFKELMEWASEWLGDKWDEMKTDMGLDIGISSKKMKRLVDQGHTFTQTQTKDGIRVTFENGMTGIISLNDLKAVTGSDPKLAAQSAEVETKQAAIKAEAEKPDSKLAKVRTELSAKEEELKYWKTKAEEAAEIAKNETNKPWGRESAADKDARNFGNKAELRAKELEDLKAQEEEEANRILMNITAASNTAGPVTLNIDGKREQGGPVVSGKTYLAGEGGPEILLNSKTGTYEFITSPQLLTAKTDGSVIPITSGSDTQNALRYSLNTANIDSDLFKSSDSTSIATPENPFKLEKHPVTAFTDNLTAKGSEIAAQAPQYFGSLVDGAMNLGGKGIKGISDAGTQIAEWTKEKGLDFDGGRMRDFMNSGLTHTQKAISESDVVRESQKTVENATVDRITNKYAMSRLFELEDGRIFVEFADGQQFTVSSTFMPKVFNLLKSQLADKSLTEKLQPGDDKKVQKELADATQKKQEDVATNIISGLKDLGQQGMSKVGEILKGVNDKLNSGALWTKEKGLGIDGGQIATAVNRDLLTSRKEGEVSNYGRAVNAFTQAGPDRIKQLLAHKTGRSSHFDKAAVKPLEASTAMTSYGPKATANSHSNAPSTGTSDQAAQQQLANVMSISPSTGVSSNQVPTGTMPTPTAPTAPKFFKPGPNPKDIYANGDNPEVNKLIEDRAKELISKITTTDPLLKYNQVMKAWEQAAAEINAKIVKGDIKVAGVDPAVAGQDGANKEGGNASDQAARAALGGLFSAGMGKLGDINTVNGASGTSSSADMMGQLSSVMNQGAGSMGSIPTIGGSGGSGGMPGIPGVGIPGTNMPTGAPSGINAPGTNTPTGVPGGINAPGGIPAVNNMASGGINANKAMDYFMSKGWSKEQAAGIVGNLQQESGAGLNPAAQNKNGMYGLAQWDSNRRAGFEKKYGKSIKGSTAEEQMEYINWELTQGPEKRAGKALKNATNAQEAAHIFEKKYERSGGSALDKRIANANKIYGSHTPGQQPTSGQGNIPITGAPGGPGTNMPTGGSGGGLLSNANKYLGMSEGQNSDQLNKFTGVNTQNTPWCGAFVGGVLKESGYRVPKGHNLAKNYLNYGQDVGGLSNAKPGDIAVFNRGGGGKGHVGIIQKIEGDKIYLLGGNQGKNGVVSVSARDINKPGSELVGIRRPGQDDITDPQKVAATEAQGGINPQAIADSTQNTTNETNSTITAQDTQGPPPGSQQAATPTSMEGMFAQGMSQMGGLNTVNGGMGGAVSGGLGGALSGAMGGLMGGMMGGGYRSGGGQSRGRYSMSSGGQIMGGSGGMSSGTSNGPMGQVASGLSGSISSSKDATVLKPELVGRLSQDLGITPEQASGIVGNLAHESGNFKYHQELNPKSGRGGIGWAQWTGPRRKAFEKFAAEKGLDLTSNEASYQFLKHELNTTEKASLDAVKKTRSAQESAQAFEGKFERAGVKHYASRFKHADEALAAYNKNPASSTSQLTGGPGNPPGSPGGLNNGASGGISTGDPTQQAAGYQLPNNQPTGMGPQLSNVALDKSGNLTGSNQIPEDMKSMRIKTSNGQTKTLGEMGISTFDQLQQSGGQAFSGGANDPATLMATNMVAKDLGDNFDRVTAQNDAYHQRNKPTSGHTQGNKADFTVKNMSYADAHKRTADTLSRQGLVEGKDFKIISKKHGTGDHIDFKLTDTGKNKISQNYANTQTQQGLPPGQQVSQQNQPTTGATNSVNADPAKQADPATWKPGNQVAANTSPTGVDNGIQIDEATLKQDMQNGNLPMFASAGQGVSDVTDITNSNAMVRGFDQSTSVASSTKVTSAALQPTDNEYQRNKIIAPTGVESGPPKKGDSFASQIVPDHKPSTNPTDQLISTPPKKGDSFASQIMPDTKPTGTPTNVPAQGFSSSTSVASSTKLTSAALQPTDNEYQRNKIIAPTGTPSAPVTDARTGGFYGNGTTVADHVTKPLPAPDTKPTGTPTNVPAQGFSSSTSVASSTKLTSAALQPTDNEYQRNKIIAPTGTPSAPVTAETKTETPVASKPAGTDVGPQIPDDVKLERDLESSVNAGPTDDDKLEKDLASAVEAGKPTTGTSDPVSKPSGGGGGGSRKQSSSGGGQQVSNSSNEDISNTSSQRPQMPSQPQQPVDMISSMLGNLFGMGSGMMGGMMGMGGVNNMGGMGGSMGGLFPSQNPFSVTPPAMPTMDSTGFDSQIALNPPQTQFDIQGATASTIQNNAESQAMQTDMMGESVSSAMSASNSGGSSAQPQGDPGVASEGMLSPRHNSPQANAGASGMNKDDMGSVAVDPLGDDIANRLFSLLGPAFFAGAKNQAMEAKVNNYVENTFV
jgi:uncharacterized protein (TIGR02594 family)